MEDVLIICEPGGTHDGDLDTMRRLILVAARAGADVCKFQWVSDPVRLAERRHATEYLDAYRRIAFPTAWLPILKAACELVRLKFMCTVYLPEDVAIIAPLVKRFKVASFEVSDEELITEMCQHGRPILASCGMGQLPCGVLRLHCVSAYPAPLRDLNLAVLWDGQFSGFSDHSGQTITGALAVAAGARILEVHYRLAECDPTNPDFPHSLDPEELAEYIRLARVASVAVGDGKRRSMPSEKEMERYCVR